MIPLILTVRCQTVRKIMSVYFRNCTKTAAVYARVNGDVLKVTHLKLQKT